jgi:hypothetical protein
MGANSRDQQKLLLGGAMAEFHCGAFIARALAGAGAARAVPRNGAPVFEPPARRIQLDRFYLGVHAGGGVDHFAFPFAIFAPGGFVKGTAASPRLTHRRPQVGFNYSFRSSTSSPGLKSITARPASEARPPSMDFPAPAPPSSAQIEDLAGAASLGCSGAVSALFNRRLHLWNG